MDLYWIHDGDCSLVSGASPVQRCLQAGDKETGITVRITINWGCGSNHHGQAWGFANQPNFGIYRIMKYIYIYIYVCSIGKPSGEKVKKKQRFGAMYVKARAQQMEWSLLYSNIMCLGDRP